MQFSLSPLNFLNFSVAFGFFIGLVMGVLKGADPSFLVFFVVIVSMIFYLFGLIFTALFLRTLDPKKSLKTATQNFNKSQIDTAINDMNARLLRSERDFARIKNEISVFSIDGK